MEYIHPICIPVKLGFPQWSVWIFMLLHHLIYFRLEYNFTPCSELDGVKIQDDEKGKLVKAILPGVLSPKLF